MKKRQIRIGAASTTVTLTLAAVLVIISQNTAPTRADRFAVEKRTAAPTKQSLPSPIATVRLPSPPAPQSAAVASPVAAELVRPAPPAPGIAPLQPRPNRADTPIAKVIPLKPRAPSAPSETKPSSPPASAVTPPPEPVAPEDRKEGRALLRMLEAGEGPVIEIAWPPNADTRARLYSLLTRCYGMRTALLDGGGTLYVADNRPGEAWQVIRDAVSGFVRQPTGALPRTERQIIANVRSRHGLRAASPVRVFPRSVDATLLGGLRRIVGDGYASHETIRARYTLDGSRISIADVSADGVSRQGAVTVLPAKRCG